MTMTTQQKISAINSLCLTNQFGLLAQLMTSIPGSLSILLSDRPAEEKRRDLLELLRRGAE